MVSQESMHLDPALRDWVLFPIFIVMLLVGILRHYVTLLVQSPPKKLSLAALREQRALTRGNILRQNANHLPPAMFEAQKTYLQDAYQAGTYLKEPPREDGQVAPPPNPLTDPGAMDGMLGGLKSQMIMMVPQQILMYWINAFFSGFVLIKLPFPLTAKFKAMLQRGIDTLDMDVTWVSSLSWYFLNLVGLNSIYRLILGDENAADSTRDMQAMGPMGGMAAMGMPGQQQDFQKLFNAERENLELVHQSWVCDGVEERVLEMFGKGQPV
ncbi:transmembrane protein [Atractiella rhizophila]|nr:transmembrane protein [Atractiella rhizophila]